MAEPEEAEPIVGALGGWVQVLMEVLGVELGPEAVEAPEEAQGELLVELVDMVVVAAAELELFAVEAAVVPLKWFETRAQ